MIHILTLHCLSALESHLCGIGLGLDRFAFRVAMSIRLDMSDLCPLLAYDVSNSDSDASATIPSAFCYETYDNAMSLQHVLAGKGG